MIFKKILKNTKTLTTILIGIFFSTLYFVDSSFQELTFFIFLPIILGFILQERIFGVQHSRQLGTILWVGYISVLILPLLFYFESIKENQVVGINDYYFFSVVGFTFMLVFWSIVQYEKNYIIKITLEVFLVQAILFSYWVFTYPTLLGAILPILLLVFLFLQSGSKFLELLFSISSGIISLIFWGHYIFFLFEKYSQISFPYINVFDVYILGEFFILGMSLGFIMQSIMMLGIYLPSKHHFYNRDHRQEIRKMNKKYLERFDEKTTSLSILVFLCILTLGMVILHSYTYFMPINIFIGVMFIVSTLGLNGLIYLKNTYETQK